MNSLPKISSERLEEEFLLPFIESLRIEVKQQQAFLKKSDQLYTDYYNSLLRIKDHDDPSHILHETDNLKTTLIKVLDHEVPEKREIPFEEEFEPFVNSSSNFLLQLPDKVRIEQLDERFDNNSSDSFLISLIKPFKRFAFILSTIPQRVSNLFRKEKKIIPKWKHTIPVKAMVTYYFINQFVEDNLFAFKELLIERSNTLSITWSIIKDINEEVTQYLNREDSNSDEFISHIKSITERQRINDNIQELNKRIELWLAKGKEDLKKLKLDYEEALVKVDTIELSESNFSNAKLEKERKNYLRDYKIIFSGWKNALFAQLDDIQIDLELYHIKYNSLLQFHLLQKSCRSKIEQTISQNIQVINREIAALVKSISKKEDEDEVKAILIKEKTVLQKKLDRKIIPQAIDALYNQDLTYLIDRLDAQVVQSIDAMKEQRIVFSESEYNKPIRKSELSLFNPRELVRVSIYKDFANAIKKIKSSVNENLEKLEIALKELSGIAEYNLDAAIQSIEDPEESKRVKEIANEGAARTKTKTENIELALLSLQNIIVQSLKEAIAKMNAELISLTVNENILELRLRLATAKAVKRTNSYRDRIKEIVSHSTPLLLNKIKRNVDQGLKVGNAFLIRFGLKHVHREITAELSDFLNETNVAINKLPFVYKRLYRVKPLTEDVFFEGRELELEVMVNSLKKWEVGSFESTLLIGEKGSGASSLINLFLKFNQQHTTLRFKFDRAYHLPDELLSFFKELLQYDGLESFEDLIVKLNSESKKVIILEDAQHLYLRKIGGFQALQQLFEIISKTSKNVFWLVEVTTYTYQFLQKTVRIASYFKHSLKLANITDKQMINLIMKRHRVSGYNLRFEIQNPTASELKKLRKMNLDRHQEYLKNQYFVSLNNFANSNISLALLYWLRSTLDVSENTIIIGMLGDMKFDFLSSMSDENTFTLHTLLLHDSLNAEEHAALFHQSVKQSKMTLMVLEDNGILIGSDGRYKINRLLYRQVVNVLRQKNILH